MGSLLQNTIFGRTKIKPNIFIGGVAPVLSSPSLLATKLNVLTSRIRGFKITGSDIECEVTGVDYKPLGFTDDKSITYFEEHGGKIKLFQGNGYYPFRGCSNLRIVKMKGIQNFGPSAFGNCVNLEYIDTPNLKSIDSESTNDGITIFQNCNKLTELNFPELTTFRANYALSGLKGITLVNIPKCTVLGKSIGNNNFFFNIKSGCTINVNAALQTANEGAPDDDLVYAGTVRGAIINYI